MDPGYDCEICLTCGKKHMNFHKTSEFDGDSKLNIHDIIYQHFWFKEDDLRSAIVCEICWDKVNQFHQFYLTVKKLHEHRKEAALPMFIKQEEITIEETQLQENYIDISAENQIVLDIADCKHETPEECDELSKEDEPEEVPHLRKKQKYTKELPNERVVKRKNSRKLLTLEERQAEDDFIKQHMRYICDECNIEFENFRAIKYHRIKTHKIDHVVCCGNRYKHRSILYQHVQSLLNPEAFKCEICSKSFKLKQGYVRHKEVTHVAKEDLIFKCNQCPRSFINEGLLKNHITEHETIENESAKCELCGKCFRHKNLLNKHVMAVHKKPMDFICEVCSKGFHRRWKFERHRKIHEPKAEHQWKQCPVCSKWLKNRTNWLLHMRRHKEGECKCGVCDHVLSSIKSLKRHVKDKHAPDRKRHVCEQCGREFTRADILKEHVANAHTREHLYQCEYCEKKFFTRPTMYSHRKKDHPQEWLELKNSRSAGTSVGGEPFP